MYRNFTLMLAVGIFTFGCAVGNKHDYLDSSLELDASTDELVVVATLDHRAYVLNSRKNANFVGLSRGGFGNPFDVVTLSGNPLATDISVSIASSLRKRGVDAESVVLEASQSVTDARKKLAAKGAYRSMLFTLREWKGDAMFNVNFVYDFDLNVIDNNGEILITKKVVGEENLGAADPFSPGGAELIRPRFKSLVKEIFQDPEVSRHLN